MHIWRVRGRSDESPWLLKSWRFSGITLIMDRLLAVPKNWFHVLELLHLLAERQTHIYMTRMTIHSCMRENDLIIRRQIITHVRGKRRKDNFKHAIDPKMMSFSWFLDKHERLALGEEIFYFELWSLRVIYDVCMLHEPWGDLCGDAWWESLYVYRNCLGQALSKWNDILWLWGKLFLRAYCRPRLSYEPQFLIMGWYMNRITGHDWSFYDIWGCWRLSSRTRVKSNLPIRMKATSFV